MPALWIFLLFVCDVHEIITLLFLSTKCCVLSVQSWSRLTHSLFLPVVKWSSCVGIAHLVVYLSEAGLWVVCTWLLAGCCCGAHIQSCVGPQFPFFLDNVRKSSLVWKQLRSLICSSVLGHHGSPHWCGCEVTLVCGFDLPFPNA